MIWAFLAIFPGGFATAVQAPINARLAAYNGDGMAAAAISFGMGFLLLTAATLARGAVPGLYWLAGVTRWGWTGGALGALFVWSALWPVGALGTVTLVAGLILGQMATALCVDVTRAFGLPMHRTLPQHVASVVLARVLLSRF